MRCSGYIVVLLQPVFDDRQLPYLNKTILNEVLASVLFYDFFLTQQTYSEIDPNQNKILWSLWWGSFKRLTRYSLTVQQTK